MNVKIKSIRVLILAAAITFSAGKIMAQQTTSMTEAIETGVNNYEIIKSGKSMVKAADEEYRGSKTLYLPEFTISAQQFYGTANSLHGPQYSFGEGNTSMGAPQAAQNWDVAFSSLYLANFNWNIYSFGTRRNSVRLSKTKKELAQARLEQDIFQHKIKIASAYLNLVAIREIIKVQKENIRRTEVLVSTSKSLTESGLRPTVELSMAEAELAGANIALLRARDKESSLLKDLILLMGIEHQDLITDNSLTTLLPSLDSPDQEVSSNHPELITKNISIDLSSTQNKIISAQGLPKLNLVGSLTGRGSGFKYNYAQDHNNYTRSYTEGTGIERGNYLVGFNLSWNITSFAGSRYKSSSQRYITNSLKEQLELTHRELSESIIQASKKITFTENQYSQALKQTDAAMLSYKRYESLYNNGLSTVNDLIQSIYNLSRAESDQAIIQINVWQAYLMLVAGNGDFEKFISQIR